VELGLGVELLTRHCQGDVPKGFERVPRGLPGYQAMLRLLDCLGDAMGKALVSQRKLDWEVSRRSLLGI
jgi:hypothetical protein